jgi:hypothetical protein
MEDLQANFSSKFFNLKQAFITTIITIVICVAASLFFTNHQGHYYISKSLIQVGSYPNYQEGELPILIEPLAQIQERIHTKSYIQRMIAHRSLSDSKILDQLEESIYIRELKTRGMFEIQLSLKDEKEARDLMEEIVQDIETRHKEQFAAALIRAQNYLSDIRNETKKSHEIIDELMKKNDKNPNYFNALLYAFSNQSSLGSLLSRIELTQNISLYHTARVEDVSVSKDQFYKNLKTNIKIAIIIGFLLGLIIHYLYLNKKSN